MLSLSLHSLCAIRLTWIERLPPVSGMETSHLTDLSDATPPNVLHDDDRWLVDWDELLQALMVHFRVLENEELGPDGLGAGIVSGSHAAAALTLRDMRRTGRLGELGDDAQATLLGGTLYEYSDDVPARLPAEAQRSAMLASVRSPPRSSSTASSAGGFELPSPRQTRLSTLRLELDAALQQEMLRPNSSFSAASAGTLRPPSTFEAAPSTISSTDFNGTAISLDSTLEGLAGEFEIDVDARRVLGENEEADSVVDFGDTARSVRSNGLWRSVHTVLGDSLSSAQGLPQTPSGMFGETRLATVLRHLAGDTASLDDSLVRSVQRVLQLGAVLSGQRLSDEEIAALPKVRFDGAEEQNCAICLEAYRRGDLLTTLRCSHFFHVDCLAGWLQRSSQCPLCRSSQAD
uniref:RING-type domain-containing protein n=1 Tax=Noctiluca scintillans TaxID=2966 RepID=A0A7S1F730_NOCSC